jgi:cell wall-associated NlpC family hydrolase
MDDRKLIIEEASRWLGAKWHHAACVPYVAVDCAQFLAWTYSAVGLIDKPDYTDYPRDWAAHRNEEWFINTVTKYAHEIEKPLPGDVVLFKVGRTFSHSGIVIDWPHLIHADMRAGVVLADASMGELSKRKMRFFSLF